MIDILLTVLCFSGFVYGANAWLKIKFSNTPLFCISFIGISLYFFALAGHLRTGAQILLLSGGVLSMFFLINLWGERKKEHGKQSLQAIILFLLLIFVSFLLTLNMAFTVIDDYVYWGIIGKYLYLHDHLPTAGNPLDKRILAYTPGTGLIHYFFHVIPGKYNSDISYFAQNLILISSLFVVVRKEKIKQSIIYIAILILFLTIFFGSIFSKLQVDYLLSIISFSIFWIYYNEQDIYKRVLTISMPVCFLFLVKQIGFAIGLGIVIMIAADILVRQFYDRKDKMKAFGILFMIAATSFLIKQLWANHIVAMGFMEFHSAINPESIKKAIDVFNNEQVQKGLWLFVKEIFLGPADRLNAPYIIWYTVILFLGYKIMSTVPIKNKSSFYLFSGLSLLFLSLYLFMLYCLQIIIFDVGNSSNHTVGFSRYFNILFFPIVIISLMVYFQRLLLKGRELGLKVCVSVIIVVILVLTASRVEVSLHREKQDIEVEKIARQYEDQIPEGSHSIGIITEKRNGLANLQFLYYFLPNKTDYHARQFENEGSILEYLSKKDYVLFYYPGKNNYDWLRPYFEKEEKSTEGGFFRIHRKTQTGPGQEIILERVTSLKE